MIVRDGPVLLVRRAVEEGDLRWQPPAGTIEAGEIVGRAAVRETREGTGIHTKGPHPPQAVMHRGDSLAR
ncbi:hypothetical protein GCM10010211_58640 [Streptomyces albospinus]|uniref:Nudix hydrolase domain-containing protein n=1 Tax=Streptomyces albospinus TaxID=285515 RepID=A0ABQ2VIH9_9ACTN|nr:hypothetical protein GCM10010211_58640 [Streptomyces albospinus]